MSVFQRKYNTLLVTGTTAIRVPLVKRGLVDFAVSADYTPAAGDVKILIDGAAAANVTNLPTAVATANTGTLWEFILTAAELSGKNIQVVISDAATKAIEDQSFIVETFGNASAMFAADISLANLPANVTQLLGTAWLTPGTAGTPDVNVKLWNALATVALPLVPATPGRTLVVDAAGLADANVVKIGPTGAGTAQTAGDVGVKTGFALSNAGIDALWVRALVEAYNADGAAPTVAQALMGILQRLTEFAISGTSITVKKLDGSTTAMVLTTDSSTAPTSSTRSS